jgi:Ca2+-binding RTX toxin-like protein
MRREGALQPMVGGMILPGQRQAQRGLPEMAIFKAGVSVDMTKLTPYKPLDAWGNISIEIPAGDGLARYFEATLKADSRVAYHFFGDQMDVTDTIVDTGWITAIEVWDQRYSSLIGAYNLSGLLIDVNDLTDMFSGNFEPGLFKGNDDITGSGQADLLRGYGGRDVLVGGDGNDAVSGDGESDGIEGNDGDDILRGDAGNDELDGGKGRDKLYGGSGKDFFIFDTEPGLKNADTLPDFKVFLDTIELDNVVFKGLGRGGVLDPGQFFIGGNGPVGRACIIYESGNGNLFYKDASSKPDKVKFAELDTSLSLSHKDFFVI